MNSKDLFEKAQRHIPGGVNSPVRAFGAVGGTPIFIDSGKGAHIEAVDGTRYLDYVGSWGPLILGHAHPEVIDAVKTTAEKGLSFGAPTALEIELADVLCEKIPSMDMVRLVSSGTEATMSAIRLARGYTNKDKIIKFEGCYHGHTDALLVNAGSGALTFGIPSSPGVPADFVKHTLVAQFNDLDSVRHLFEANSKDIAAIIVEPVAGNMGCIPAKPNFLPGLRALCDEYNALLIFDEVITGFRVDLNSAQGLYGVTPDLTALGKVIGGGMNVGAFGGKREILEKLSPLGPVYQAGTLSGNPIACAAGLKTLEILYRPGVFEGIVSNTKLLAEGLRALAKQYALPLVVNQIGTMLCFYFTEEETVTSFDAVMRADTEKYTQFFHAMLTAGFYFAPSAYETAIVTAAHTQQDIQNTLTAVEAVFQTLTQKDPSSRPGPISLHKEPA